MAAAYSTPVAGTLVAPVVGNVNLLSLKNNFIHLIHQADLTMNGKLRKTPTIYQYCQTLPNVRRNIYY